MYLLEGVIVGTTNCFLDFAPFLKVISNCLSVSFLQVFVKSDHIQMHMSRISHWTFLQNKTEKERNTILYFQRIICIDFFEVRL